MKKLFLALLLLASAPAFGYSSTQVWVTTNAYGYANYTAASRGALLTAVATANYGSTWSDCGNGFGSPAGNCGSPIFAVSFSASCSVAGDVLSNDQLTCTAAGGGGGDGGTYTPPAPGASTGSTGDNSSGLAAWLNAKISAVLSWVVSIITTLFAGLWSLLTDFFIFVIDQLFALVLYIVGGMTWNFSTFNPVTYWNQLPASLISVLNLIGVPIALGMIVTALGIRFILQLIPFVRWGS